jgi:hypothetical protein
MIKQLNSAFGTPDIVRSPSDRSAVNKLITMGYLLRVNDKSKKICITQLSVTNQSNKVEELKQGIYSDCLTGTEGIGTRFHGEFNFIQAFK